MTTDFAVISLSDLLTPWEDIEKRLRLAAEAGFVMAIYNPASKKRADYLKKACRIVSEYLPPETPCGYVRNIGREGQESAVLTLKELSEFPADMFTTVIIGNRTTKVIAGSSSPRGDIAEWARENKGKSGWGDPFRIRKGGSRKRG